MAAFLAITMETKKAMWKRTSNRHNLPRYERASTSKPKTEINDVLQSKFSNWEAISSSQSPRICKTWVEKDNESDQTGYKASTCWVPSGTIRTMHKTMREKQQSQKTEIRKHIGSPGTKRSAQKEPERLRTNVKVNLTNCQIRLKTERKRRRTLAS